MGMKEIEVTSFELSRRLKQLGATQDTDLYYSPGEDGSYKELFIGPAPTQFDVAAYTAEDFQKIVPIGFDMEEWWGSFEVKKVGKKWIVLHRNPLYLHTKLSLNDEVAEATDDSLPNALARMMILLVEQKVIKLTTKEVLSL